MASVELLNNTLQNHYYRTSRVNANGVSGVSAAFKRFWVASDEPLVNNCSESRWIGRIYRESPMCSVEGTLPLDLCFEGPLGTP